VISDRKNKSSNKSFLLKGVNKLGNANSDEQLKSLKLEILRTQRYLARVQMGQLYKEIWEIYTLPLASLT
jgi:hypothetical protein